MPAHFGAWIRYGDPITPEQIDFAVAHYRSAILQPWELDAAAALKQARPDMTVLAYKCLSSTRSYEPGPYFSSGISYAEATAAGAEYFAHRADGTGRIEWAGYPGHWQMAVWNPEYRDRWVGNVVAEYRDSPFDGVMADNDVYDDYYGLRPPLEGGRGLVELRAALDSLIAAAGTALNAAGRILVPNIAESRREPGRWARHARYGGGFEEVWLAWEPDRYFDPPTTLAQMEYLHGPGICVLRTASDGTGDHPNVLYGLALAWIFGAGRDGLSYTATGHDSYSGTPFVPQFDWDLGAPAGRVRGRGSGRYRRFRHGFAAANLGPVRYRVRVPAGMVDADGVPVPPTVVLDPHRGMICRMP